MSMRAWRRSRRLGRKIERRRASVCETLEPRLALTWSAIPPASIALPVPFTQVSLNSNSDATGNASISSTEVDYYRFQATSTSPFVISAKTPSSNLDPILAVYSAAGKRLAFNDNISSANKDSQTAVNLQAGLTYFVGITNRTASSRGSYTWRIDGLWGTAPDDSREQNDKFSAAANLGTLKAFTTVENLVMRDASDWYKFTTINTGKSTHYVGLEFEHRRGDLDMALYNDANELLGRSRSRDNKESVSLKGLAAGTYYVRVYGAQGAFSPQYNLVVRPALVAPVLPPPQTDLSGGMMRITDDVNWDEYISIQTQIRNDGHTASGAFNVSWYLSRDNEFSPGDRLLSRTNGQGTKYRVAGIPANGVTPQISVNLQLPDEDSVPESWSDRNTLMYVIMRIDVDGEVLETYPNGNPAENNNSGEVGPNRDHVPLALGRKTKEPATYNIDFTFAGLSASQQTIMKAAAHRWEQIIVGDIPDAAALNNNNSVQIIDDLLLFTQSIAGDGPGGNFGAAGPLANAGDGLPRISFFNIDRTDMNIMERENELYKFAIHAVGRAIGLGTAPAWRQYLVQDTMTMEVFFAGPAARAAYIDLFGVDPDPEVTPGVPVGAFGGFSYWSEFVFGDEMLTPGNYGPMNEAPISIVTVMSLVDMGYAVNPEMADDYMPPMPGPAPASAASFVPPLPGAAPVGGSSSSTSTKPSGATSTSKSTIPGNPIDVGTLPDPVDLVLLDFDYDRLARVMSGIYDFDYWRLDAN